MTDELSVFDPKGKHRQLADDLDHYLKVAGIPKTHIYQSAKVHCSPSEVQWLTNYPQHAQNASYGALLGPNTHVSPDTRMMSMCAALLRNYVDARVMTVQTVVAKMKHSDPPKCSALFIPNFYTSKEQGGETPGWIKNTLLDLIYSRHAEGAQTVLYVSNLDKLGQEWGQEIGEYLQMNYKKLQGGAQ